MYPITRDSITADISSSVAEKAVCWCEGRKNRRSLFMGRRYISAGREFPSKPTRGLHSGRGLSSESHRDGSFIDTGVDCIDLSERKTAQASAYERRSSGLTNCERKTCRLISS